jgi:hypothetical protein
VDAPRAIREAIDGLTPELRAVYDEFLDIDNALARTRAITDWARPTGTLRQPFVWLRAVSAEQARQEAQPEGRKLAWLARRAGLTVSQFSRLSRRLAKAAPEGVAA